MTIWLLASDDDDVVRRAERVRPGDRVLRRIGDDLVGIGVVTDVGAPDPVAWEAEMALQLLPDAAHIPIREHRESSLQMLDDVDGLDRAIDGVLTANRDRGA